MLETNPLIVLGDSVRITLTFVFYHLAQFPAYLEMIRKELFEVTSMTDIQALQELSNLQSVIKESLQLYPPVSTGANRESESNGVTIDGTYISPYTTIIVSTYALTRRKRSP